MSRKKIVERPLPDSLNLPPTGVDSHAHLDDPKLLCQLADVLRRARAAGVANVGQVFLSPEARTQHLPAFEKCAGPEFPELYYILGVHPVEAMNLTGAVLAAMRQAFSEDARLKAVGEIGLDFFWKDCPPLVQEEAFRLQLVLARECSRPVVIHSRDAVNDTLRILETEGFAGYPLLWHCFSGDAMAHVDRIISNGWHISVPGSVTYKANQDLRDCLRCVPLDKLLLETDCPYLAPEPWRGKENEPALSAFTGVGVGEALDMDPAALWTRTGDNARRFFGL